MLLAGVGMLYFIAIPWGQATIIINSARMQPSHKLDESFFMLKEKETGVEMVT